jgi:hypothetical protein
MSADMKSQVEAEIEAIISGLQNSSRGFSETLFLM